MHVRRGKKHDVMYTTLQVAACAVTDDDEGLECAGQLVTRFYVVMRTETHFHPSTCIICRLQMISDLWLVT